MTIEVQENRQPKIIEVTEIMEMLPHRYPFLLVDRVTDYEDGKWLRAVKNVTVNEPCFTGHFPAKPIFPGVLILEAMAQATGILAVASYGKMKEGELYYFAAIDNARFKRPVVPGDQLVLEVEFLTEKRGITKFTGKAYVDGKLAWEADLMCARK